MNWLKQHALIKSRFTGVIKEVGTETSTERGDAAYFVRTWLNDSKPGASIVTSVKVLVSRYRPYFVQPGLQVRETVESDVWWEVGNVSHMRAEISPVFTCWDAAKPENERVILNLFANRLQHYIFADSTWKRKISR